MRYTFSFALVVTLTAASSAGAQTITGPAGQITGPLDPLERARTRPVALAPGEVMVDDMIFDRTQLRAPDASTAQGASFESFTARPWEFGLVPITFLDAVTDAERQSFFAACSQWAPAGVVCVARTSEPTYVGVTRDDDGCYSKVGMGTSGAQTLNLGVGCWRQGTIAHELGHTLGMIHEHQRADRDTYVTINLANVEEGTEGNFTRVITSRLWTPYDFGSVMHYGRLAFSTNGSETISVKPEYASAATSMGQRTGVSTVDVAAMTSIYNLPPRVFRTYTATPRQFTISRDESVGAMYALNAYYTAPQGLARANGLSLGGRPDFLGLAAWFFDIYVNTRFAGYEPIEARYNVQAFITQSEEWRAKHPGQASAIPFAIASRLPFDRTELLAVLERLDAFYSAPEGLQRPQGLSLGGQPDFLGIAAWVVDVYMTRRFAGASPNAAWASVVSAIQATDEWRSKHPPSP